MNTNTKPSKRKRTKLQEAAEKWGVKLKTGDRTKSRAKRIANAVGSPYGYEN